MPSLSMLISPQLYSSVHTIDYADDQFNRYFFRLKGIRLRCYPYCGFPKPLYKYWNAFDLTSTGHVLNIVNGHPCQREVVDKPVHNSSIDVSSLICITLGSFFGPLILSLSSPE